MLHIKNGLYPLWDYELAEETSTARLSVNHPVRREKLMSMDMPWEGDGSDYFCVIPDDGFFRMYYLGWKSKVEGKIYVCYAESRDGLTWERPDLGIYEYEGSTHNNIISGPNDRAWDNFYVMKDENPACPPERRYKAVAMWEMGKSLMCLTSGDGIHFEPYKIISRNGAYDSLNTLHWNRHTGKYYVYFRGFHGKEDDAASPFNETWIRDISVSESSDFEHWSAPVHLDFMGGDDYPLYTNCVTAYPGNDSLYVGFPSRYCERRSWTKNYDRLCGKEARLERMIMQPRYGLVVTDCVFMFSRDMVHWHRFEEAFMRPGPECPTNWVYGDCYPATGLLTYSTGYEGEEEEYSLLRNVKRWCGTAGELYRYSIRKDGFASFKADYAGASLVTRPFTCDAEALALNFSTSARGGIYVTVEDEDGNPIPGYESCEIFGDSTNRLVDLDEPFGALAGRVIRLRFSMKDAELFALRFIGKEELHG